MIHRHSDRLLLGLAAILAFMLWRDVRADVWGAMNGGETAFVVARDLPCRPACWPPLVRVFEMKLDLPDTPNPKGWR